MNSPFLYISIQLELKSKFLLSVIHEQCFHVNVQIIMKRINTEQISAICLPLYTQIYPLQRCFPGRNGSNTIYRFLRADNWSCVKYTDNFLVKGSCIKNAQSAPTQMLLHNNCFSLQQLCIKPLPSFSSLRNNFLEIQHFSSTETGQIRIFGLATQTAKSGAQDLVVLMCEIPFLFPCFATAWA